MTDQHLRAAERAALTGDLDARVALVRARLRAGESVSLVVREVVCVKCSGAGSFRWLGGHVCSKCDGTGKAKHGDHVVTWGEAPLSVLLPLRALVGCEVSRALEPRTCGPGFPDGGCANEVKDDCWRCTDEWPVDLTVRALAQLAADLPPVRVEVECGCFNGHDFTPVYLCARCTGTGKRTCETPGDRYLLAAVAIAAARAALPWAPGTCREDSCKCGCHVFGCSRDGRPCCGREPVFRAIQAAEAWRACPCLERGIDLRSGSPRPFYLLPVSCDPAGTTPHSDWLTVTAILVEELARLTDVRPAIREAVLTMTGGAW